jgi:hypothetical protein
MKAIIYRPSKSSMQSGFKNTRKWLLRSEDKEKYIEEFAGWTGSKNTEQQVTLSFDKKDEAINFAKAQSWEYEVIEPQERKISPKSYIDNFK